MNEMNELLTRPQVEERAKISRSAIYRMMRKNAFPLPIRVGERSVRWHRQEIETWIASRPRATGECPVVMPIR